MPTSAEVVQSLDDVLPAGTDSLVTDARNRRLLNDIAIGVFRQDKSYIRCAGKRVTPASRFLLGSITKTYTAELLAILTNRGVVHPSDPLSRFLSRRPRDPGPRPITLADLATHHSGLPRLPPGLPRLRNNPYARYTAGDLVEYLDSTSLQLPEPKSFLYSNLGYSVLGYALAQASGQTYEQLLQTEILTPLGMHQTTLALVGRHLPPALLKGHTQAGLPAQHWTFDACAPCGALCSTVGDQLKWMAWLLSDPARESWRQREAIPGGGVGLGWMIRPGGSSFWHNGGTYGFSSWMQLDRERQTGVVILSNRFAAGVVNALGAKLEAAMAGRPITPLQGDYGLARARLIDPIRIAVSWRPGA